MKQHQIVRLLLVIAVPAIIFGGLAISDRLVEIEKSGYNVPSNTIDLPAILERGVLKVTMDYNSTNYFVYRGQPMGFHLEMAQLFANHLGVELEVYLSNNFEENISCLMTEGECDLIAMDLPVTRESREYLSFAKSHIQSEMVLVQRLPQGWHNLRSTEIEANLIRNQLDLAGKTVHVPNKSAFIQRMHNLMEEIGEPITIVAVDQSAEELIERVSTGEIEYAISFGHVAHVNQNYFANIDTQTPVSFSHNLSWAVRHDAPLLRAAIDTWMSEFTTTSRFSNLFARYFHNPRSLHIARSQFHSLGGGKISIFDHLFQHYADIIGWDWRLIASLAFQESRFDSTAVSWAGAFGVMQLMPNTAAMFNVTPESPPAEHIIAGIKYLYWIDSRLRDIIVDDTERVKFVLASYNVGLGHVLDARRLAEKFGRNPNVWENNVDYFILNKSNPKYYLDPVVQHGFARGYEPYRFVIEILQRFEHYKNAIDRG